ncbi:hypothetical protein CKJ90_32955, partial [Klebsiella pneumoniae]
MKQIEVTGLFFRVNGRWTVSGDVLGAGENGRRCAGRVKQIEVTGLFFRVNGRWTVSGDVLGA